VAISAYRNSAQPRRSLLSLAIPCALLMAAASPAAYSQEDPTTLEKITVTGTNIPRTDTETASPVQLVTREEIDRSGKATLAEYLQTLTADSAGSIPKTFGNGFAMGSAGISLRGLGAGSTLVLLNGRRVAAYGLADDGQKIFTDLSSIPMDAVERVEVLKDGASSVYGSDAIAGVVNIILRSDFTGAIFTGSYGMSEESDGDQRKGTLTAGTGDLAEDGWNAFFSLDVGKTDGIAVRDRRDRKWIGTGDIRRWGYSISGSPFLGGAITGGGTAAGGSPVGAIQNPVTGLFESLPGCAQLSDVTPQDPAGGCLWDLGNFRDLTPEEEYVNFFSRATFALSDNAEIYTELGYSKKDTTFHNTPSGVSGAWGYPGGPVNANSGPGAVVLGPDHPDNPYDEAVRLRYTAFDVGPRTTYNTNEFMRLLAGVKGYAAGWDYDIGLLHSESTLTNERTGFLRYSAVQCALADPNCPLGVWRIGDDAGLNTPELYAAISPRISAEAESKLDILDFRASRSLMDLPGGALGLALGAEYRRQTATLTPQTYTDSGDIIGLGFSAYDGVQKVSAVYAELLAPLHDTFEASLAVRADHYEGGDTAVKPKVGLKWTPADWIAVRGTYAEGFRAPNPAESGDGGLAAFTTARDPVRCPGGVPAPGGDASDCDPVPVAVITRPNPDLDPEESKSYSLGLVLQPTRTTTLTIDAWKIERTDEIAPESTALAIAAGNVVRDDDLLNGVPGTGTLLAVNTNYINANTSTVQGIDLDVRQEFDLSAYGKLRLDLQWSHIDKFEREESDGATYEFAGTHGNCDVTNCMGTPEDRINFGVTWDIGAWSISGIANHVSSIDNVLFEGDVCANSFADGSDAPNGCELASFTTVDLSARWRATEDFEIFGSVQNVADRVAPLDPLTYGAVNYNPLHSSGAIGRFFTVGARYTFN
jgi:iron complex outermembrane recepter protein